MLLGPLKESTCEECRPLGGPVGEEGLGWCSGYRAKANEKTQHKPLLTRWCQFSALRETTFRRCKVEREHYLSQGL